LPSLKELQRRFVSSAYGDIAPAFVASVAGGGRLSARDAVDVYRKGYPARLSEALGETFEACWRVLGDRDFLEACEEYARSVPSTSHNLSDYGRSFPGFLKKSFGREAPFIEDLAVLEWEYKELFHQAPHDPLPAAVLAGSVKDDSVLVFGPAIRFMKFGHAVHRIWKRDRRDDSPIEKREWAHEEWVLLYKGGGAAVGSSALAAPEASVLSSLMKGARLNKALSKAKGMNEDRTKRLFSFLADAGVITEVR
jgi:hypothetical protein